MTGPAGRCGHSTRPTCRPSSPTSPTTLTNCRPALAQTRRWWRCGCGPRWAGRVAPPRRGGGGPGRPSGWPGPGICPGGWPPSLGSVLAGESLAACWRPGWGWSSPLWRPWRLGGRCGFGPARTPLLGGGGRPGEQRTARLLGPLERHGWAILHDLAVPGSRANIDHLAIGPGGVFVIDSRQYRGRLQLDPSGRLWHGRYPLAPHCRRSASRPTKPPGSCPTQALRCCRSWPSRRPGPMGQGAHGWGAGGAGQAPAKHASRPPRSIGARAGRRSGQPGPGPISRCRLTPDVCRAPQLESGCVPGGYLPCCWWPR